MDEDGLGISATSENTSPNTSHKVTDSSVEREAVRALGVVAYRRGVGLVLTELQPGQQKDSKVELGEEDKYLFYMLSIVGRKVGTEDLDWFYTAEAALSLIHI